MKKPTGTRKSAIPNPTLPRYDTLTVGKEKIRYLLRESGRAKNVNLKISMEKGLEVVVPFAYPLSEVANLLKGKEQWILEKLAVMEQRNQQKKAHSFTERNAVSFLGKAYRVVTVYQQGNPSVQLVDDKIIVILPQEYQERILQLLEKWLRVQAKHIILQRLELAKEKLKIDYNQVFIKDQKTRWGSCSGQRNLNFNYRLVMAPLPVIDYLVAHELAHLVEMNHSKRFWSLVASICPEYKAHRQWLQEHGGELTL